jgi:nucleoside-diphosphate-sugar epimerase
VKDSTSWFLLTGATGFLGRRVLRRLADLGIAVRALVRPGTPPDVFGALLEEFPNAHVEAFPASFSDQPAVRRALAGVRTVLHVAASKTGSAAAQVANTVIGSGQLYQASTEARVQRFVLVSSFGVMGASNLQRGAVVDERTPLDPHPEWRDPYSFAKHRQEQLAWTHRQASALPLVVVRPGVIFGPGQNILSGRVGLSCFGVFLHLGGDNIIPLTYVDNCADAVIQAGLVAGVEGEIFCVVDDALPTSRQLLHRYRREIKAIGYVPVPFPVLRQLARVNAWYSRRTQGYLPAVFTPYKVNALWAGHHYSNQKAKSKLGWTVRIPMQQALDLTFADQPRDRVT